LHQVSALLEGLRALGSGRVLPEVLALVIDSALEVASAERGFIMLAGPDGTLEFKIARGKGRVTLPGLFSTSRKIPEQVFTTGEARMVADLLEGAVSDNANTVMLGIRQVFCTPLKVVRFVDQADAPAEEKRIGVLYLDSQKKGALLSRTTQASLEALATEAAMAIENARLYRQALEKARMEQELKIAAEIQQALLPDAQRKGTFFEAVAQSVPCRSIGGDFFDYVELADAGFGFAVGDVAGKGAPAALLTAVIQGMFTALASLGMPPSQTLSRVNQGIFARAIESRFCTAFYAVITPGGQLACCNAGHNPPMVFTRTGVRRLEKGGLFLGMFEHAAFEQETIALEPGDILVAFSDGVTEAMNTSEEEYGEDRLRACVEAAAGTSPQEMLDGIFLSVREFSRGAEQSDDITALVLRYDGCPRASGDGDV
jgi:serine phosphatase RsbU (regulator of sigma subunit)